MNQKKNRKQRKRGKREKSFHLEKKTTEVEKASSGTQVG